MSIADSITRNVAMELRRYVLMRGGADTLESLWLEAAAKIISIVKQKPEKTIYHICTPKYPDPLYPALQCVRYEIPFQELAKKIDAAEEEGYNPTNIELHMKADLGNIYGLPTRLKLIE